MMKPVARVRSEGADPVCGNVVLDVSKTAWTMGMLLSAALLIPFATTTGAVVVFLALTYAGLLLGHSVGMHRFMIHRTFDAPRWLERLLVYIGVLVGLSGPFGVIRIHDIRDWAQRQPECHDFFSHRRGFLADVLWQLTCKFEFDNPPSVVIEDKFAADPWYQWMDRTWRYHQLLLAVPLYLLGGWSWVVWGVCARVAVSNIGHWTITYLCHNPGPGHWHVDGASVQASNLPGFGVISCGECWHNNHHAFPESAQIGLYPGQTDPAWQLIRRLGEHGLATNIGRPRASDQREDIRAAAGESIPDETASNLGRV
ncbi:MAG: acyl-CoA desaturase [Pseudomonadota bacterium]